MGAAGAAAYATVRKLTAPRTDHYFFDKSVVVTGGASGIGRAIVEELIVHGARVLAVDVNAAALEALREEYPTVSTLELDLVAEGAAERLLEESLELLGDVDVLFSNAGIVWAATFESMTAAAIERLVATNFTMQVLVSHAWLPYFLKRGEGVIAYTGSLSSYVYSPFHTVYTGTKGGLKNFVAALRRELPPNSGVQLTIIHPNMTRTNLVPSTMFDEVEKRFPLQAPHQVAEAFLAGVARGARQVFINIPDIALAIAEQVAPISMDYLFRFAMDDHLVELAEEAIHTHPVFGNLEPREEPS